MPDGDLCRGCCAPMPPHHGKGRRRIYCTDCRPTTVRKPVAAPRPPGIKAPRRDTSEYEGAITAGRWREANGYDPATRTYANA